jgi:hypothetical protein
MSYTVDMQNLDTFIVNTLTFINTAVIPFILGIAFFLLVINVVRYFIIGAGNNDSREKAKSLALYSTLAFVLIVIFWGLVNLLASSIGLDGRDMPGPDYCDTPNCL